MCSPYFNMRLWWLCDDLPTIIAIMNQFYGDRNTLAQHAVIPHGAEAPRSICGIFSFRIPQRTLVGKSGPRLGGNLKETTHWSCWYLLISDDIWWYVDLLWNTNLVHVQTICSAWSHDWTQSCNMTRYDELGKSLDRSQQCPATRMHTFPSAKPLLFLSQFQDEIGATNYSTCERPWLLRTSLTSWCWNLYPRGQGETNLSNSMFLLGNTGMIIQPPRMES